MSEREQQKRLLVVSQGIPHPTAGASLVLYFHYIQGLRDAGYRILHVLSVPPGSETALADYRARIETPNGVEVLPVTAERLINSGRFFHRLDRTVLTPVKQAIARFAPDAGIALDFSNAWAMLDLPVQRRMVWLGDFNFESYFYNARYALAEGTGTVRQWILSYWHSALWKFLYGRVLRHYHSIILSSGSAEATMRCMGLSGTYLPYPWPAERIVPSGTPKAAKPTFFFFGNLVGLGSRSALHLMTEGIYPELVKTFGHDGFEIRISGRGDLPQWVTEMIGDKPEIRYLGFVLDLDEVMSDCHAVLVPIDVPVGNRSRIVTALSKRLPVVAHVNTSLGNPDLVDGKTCYLARTPAEFIERLKLTVEVPADTDSIAEAGLALYRRRFAPQAAVAALLDRVAALVSL